MSDVTRTDGPWRQPPDVTTTNAQQAGAVVTAEYLRQFREGIAASRAATPRMGGTPILRLLREGIWVYGQEAIEVQEGSNWVINTLSAEHGYVCWSRYGANRKDEILGERMVPINRPKPDRPEPIQSFEWADQRTFLLKCLDGEDAGTQVLYKISSVGGMNETDDLLASLEKQIDVDQVYFCPVVTMLVDSYPHPKWGKIYTPVFKINAWADMNGNIQGKPSLTVTSTAAPARAAVGTAAPATAAAEATAAPQREPAPAATAAAAAPTTRRRPR